MPRSKKPRKAHRPKPVSVKLGAPRAVLEGVISQIGTTETAFLLKLRTGEIGKQDCADALSLMNYVMFSICRQRSVFNEKDYPREEFLNQVVDAAKAIRRIMDRIKDGLSAVGTADDYGLILDTLEACTRFAREQIEKAPTTFIDEWNGARLVVAGSGSRTIRCGRKTIEWCYEQAQRIGHMTLAQQSVVFDALERDGINAPEREVVQS